MIITDKNEYINGSTVLAPNSYPKVKKDTKEKVTIDRKALIEERNKRTKSKLKVIRNISLVFIVGVTIVGRYGQIYNMQRQLNTLNTKISDINKDNENLRIELVKYSNLSLIEEIATTKLKMIKPTKADIMYVDMTKDAIKEGENVNKK
ncbi:septum formation initiator family protein [uncultured Clostridium sp.]|uniref:septum formation initiator family protein n=1 Tax=uncultured Clostridium sp. TaxID=59620 RepID=UPI0028EAF0E5|nr:cell division protein FtsL [uncultured Clostridium sp.]